MTSDGEDKLSNFNHEPSPCARGTLYCRVTIMVLFTLRDRNSSCISEINGNTIERKQNTPQTSPYCAQGVGRGQKHLEISFSP